MKIKKFVERYAEVIVMLGILLLSLAVIIATLKKIQIP